jgi:hypothetical protein
MSEIKSGDELIQFFKDHPHVQQLHFTENGEHHLNAYDDGNGNLVTRIAEHPQHGFVNGDIIVHSFNRSDFAEQLGEQVLESESQEPVTESVITGDQPKTDIEPDKQNADGGDGTSNDETPQQ